MKNYKEFLAEDLSYFMVGASTPFDKLGKSLKKLNDEDKSTIMEHINKVFSTGLKNLKYNSFEDFINDKDSYINIKAKSSSVSFNTRRNNRRKKVYGTVKWKELHSIETFIRRPTKSYVHTMAAALFIAHNPRKIFISNEIRQSQKLEDKSISSLQKCLDQAFEQNDLKGVDIIIGDKVYSGISKILTPKGTQTKADFVFVDEDNNNVLAVSLKDKSAIGYQFNIFSKKILSWFSKSKDYKRFISLLSERVQLHYKSINKPIPDRIVFSEIRKSVEFAIKITDRQSRINFIYGADNNKLRADAILKGTAGKELLDIGADGQARIITDGYVLNYPDTDVPSNDEMFLVTRSESTIGMKIDLNINGQKVEIVEIFGGVTTRKGVEKRQIL